MKPRLDSSNSRRSEMAISVGHFMAIEPSSVGKVWTGRPSTLPPPSTPRVRAIQPYFEYASVMRVAYAQAAFIHRYLSWLEPSTFSSKLNSCTFLKLLPYGNRPRTRGIARATYRESSDSRNDFHCAYSTLSKIFARSRGFDSSVQFSKLNIEAAVPETNGACDPAATLEIIDSKLTSSGPRPNS